MRMALRFVLGVILLSLFAAAAQAAYPVAHADLDGDGTPDLLSRSANSGRLFYTRMSPSAVPSALIEILPTLGLQWTLAAQGDFNADGKADLVWRNSQTNQVALWLMDGPRPAEGFYLRAPDASWRLIGAADFNGDTAADLAWLNDVSHNVEVWLMVGSTITSSAVVAVLPHGHWQPAAFADFNGDGKSDMLWHDRTSAESNAIWLMSGTTVIVGAWVTGLEPYHYADAVGDFNGVGKADILSVNRGIDLATVWMMNGYVVSSTHQMAFDRRWGAMAVADFNGDLRDDILWQLNGGGRQNNVGNFSLWLMNGPSWGAYTAFPNPITDVATPVVQPYLPWPRNPF